MEAGNAAPLPIAPTFPVKSPKKAGQDILSGLLSKGKNKNSSPKLG
jgi:hypothetical protein